MYFLIKKWFGNQDLALNKQKISLTPLNYKICI